MNLEFERELRESLYIHRPLNLHRERSLEAAFPHKRVAAQRAISGMPRAGGTAALEQHPGLLRMSAPLRSDRWPEGAPEDGDYCNFGTARMVFDLENGDWQECIWEFAAMPRDAVTQLCFYVFCSGRDVSAGESLCYDFKGICLEQAENPEHELGWENPNPGIRLSSAGYFPCGKKTAVAAGAGGCFQLVDADSGRKVFSGPVERTENPRGRFEVLDFSAVCQPGRYVLKSGDLESPVFEISGGLREEALWKAVNFFYCQRCGFPVPRKHSACHQDILAHHNGMAMSYSGGWHDAGDQSQQSAQTGEVVQALFENANRVEKGSMLYLRLMEEAQWGLDFILRTRFGDGFRATSAGATRITDGLMGNFDDVEARVHDHSFENFLFSGVEAYAAGALRGYDEGLAECALKAAREDFAFAEKKFALTGVDPAHMFEHTYHSGLSQYYAVIVWAASCLFEAANEEEYARAAREYAGRLLACQEQGDAGIGLTGFFYRDESRKAIVHFNHQAREHQFMQALEALCRTQPDAEERPLWESAMKRYGGYLKAIAGNTAPYGMLPTGVHKLDEWRDRELFPYLHVSCVYGRERKNYQEQLLAGRELGGGYVLRNFPVWFSFRGNAAVMLSMGKAAGILGRYFKDRELAQLAKEQLYWMWGKNPFGQSLVYGMGQNYCRQYAVLTGESVGEVPVGVETFGNGDEPYWPQNNNATFREVWVGSACRYLQVCAELCEEDEA